MAKFPAFPMWTDAYLADTTHLTTLQHGAFVLLLFAMWRSKDGYLPDDDSFLARVTGMERYHWLRNRPVLERLNHVANGKWSNKRAMDERDFLLRRVEQNSIAGKASALKRLNRDTTPVERVLSDRCNTNSTPTPTPITTVIPNGIPVVGAAPLARPVPKASRWKADDAVPFDWLAAASATRVRHGLPDIDLKLEAERFANHWSSKPGKDGLKLDWRKTWINWALTSKGSGHGQGPRKPTAHENFIAGSLALMQELGGGSAEQSAEDGDADSLRLPLLPP